MESITWIEALAGGEASGPQANPSVSALTHIYQSPCPMAQTDITQTMGEHTKYASQSYGNGQLMGWTLKLTTGIRVMEAGC